MNSKGIHKLMSLVCVLVLALSIPSMVVADDDDDDRRCKLQGTWIYSYELPYGMGIARVSMTINGTGDNSGTMEWDFIAPSSHPEVCPSCYWTSSRGVWEKSGPKTYDFTAQSFYVENGVATIAFLSEGTITLMECSTAEIYLEYKIVVLETGNIWPGSYQPAVMQRLLLHQPLPIE